MSTNELDFEIAMSPEKVLLTTPMTVTFSVEPANWGVDDIPEITWSFEPEIRSPTKRVVAEDGMSMDLESIYLDEDSEYTVTVSVR